MAEEPARTRGGDDLYGLLAEFDTVDKLMHAARAVRDAGYRRWDTYSPFPVHGIEGAMGLRDTRLPWLVLAGGLAGCGGGLLMQWWMNAKNYPFVIAGKPLFSLPANIPVAFELTILLASISAVAGIFILNDLPRYYHPTFRSERFRRVTTDRFFVCVEAADPKFDVAGTEKLLRSLGATQVERLES